MPDAVVQALVQMGVLGPVVVAIGFYVLKLQKTLQEVQEKRTTDAQGVVERVLSLVDRQNETIDNLRMTLSQLGGVINELRQEVRELRSGKLR